MIMTEWVWVFLVLWIFMIAYSWTSKDDNVQAIGSMTGIVFGIIYLTNSFFIGLAMILLNFYLLFKALIK